MAKATRLVGLLRAGRYSRGLGSTSQLRNGSLFEDVGVGSWMGNTSEERRGSGSTASDNTDRRSSGGETDSGCVGGAVGGTLGESYPVRANRGSGSPADVQVRRGFQVRLRLFSQRCSAAQWLRRYA